MELENQSSEIKSSHGGARPGAGRKLGSTQKLSASTLLYEIEKQANGVPYETLLANDFIAARYSGDDTLIHKYHTMILSKVIADKVDITTNGQALQAPQLNFGPKEIPDYIDVTPIDVKHA
jgi:hypothetical protein